MSESENTGAFRVALLGNPNTGKTTLFNRLCGLRHKTSNFPGTTQEARVGVARRADGAGDGRQVEFIDLPGIYSLEIDQNEAEICRRVLAGTLAPRGEAGGAPDAVCVVLDSTNLARNLVLAGEVLRRRLPTLVLANMVDLARVRGLHIGLAALEERLGCEVWAINARGGEGVDEVVERAEASRVPNRTPPGTQDELERWAESASLAAASGPGEAGGSRAIPLTDRLDHVFTHPVLGVLCFVLVMGGLFWSIFALARYPMDWIDAIFRGAGGWIDTAMPPGILREFLSHGVLAGIGGTVIFLPQICVLFFLISLLEDTGYLARASFVMDRVLRPFGLPGHSFVPLLSSHACALPGIMACRGIPDRRQRLATILTAPFMTCSARLPVYALMTGVLFPTSPARGALAFVGCYALGAGAGMLSALLARRTILRGSSPAMMLELPSYKLPSLRTAAIGTVDRAATFLKNAGTNILAICIVLWWLGAYPKVDPPARATELRQIAAGMPDQSSVQIDGATWSRDDVSDEAARLEARHAKANSYVGRMGRAAQPLFEPLGLDWRLTVGVLTSFAAREVFVGTMAIVVAGSEEYEDAGVRERIAHGTRDDGTPIFTPSVAWSVLVFYVLAMQCLPTLVLTAKESGHPKWALLQLAWMTGLAYAAAWGVHALLRAGGMA